MKYVIVDFAASEGGALSILKDFYDYVREHENQHEWVFFLSDYYLEETNNISIEIIKKDKINRLKFDRFTGGNLINKYKPDFVINFQNTFIYGVDVPQLIYLHQAIPFQSEMDFSFFKKSEFSYAIIQKILGRNIIKGLPYADQIVVQTEWMKDAVVSMTKVNPNKIHVIPPEINVLDIQDENYTLNTSKFFYPTGDLIYKNIDIIERAVKLLPDLAFEVEITIDRELDDPRIKSIGRISREEVFRKYQESVLLFPSKIESYGMPLKEAKIMNSVILAGGTPFSREILSDYSNVYYFHVDSEMELSELMTSLVNGEIKQNYNETITPKTDSWSELLDLCLE